MHRNFVIYHRASERHLIKPLNKEIKKVIMQDGICRCTVGQGWGRTSKEERIFIK